MYYRTLVHLDRRMNQLECVVQTILRYIIVKLEESAFSFLGERALNAHLKISSNGHGLLLRLRETNRAMTAVFKRGTIPYHTHQKSQPGVVRLKYWSSFNSTDQLSATILGISMRV